MNKKLWFSGGEPNINIDDLRRDSNAVLRAFKKAWEAWNLGINENYIISGCELTVTPGVNASITEGYIYLNGEVLRVDPQTVTFGTTDIYFYEKQTTYDPAGDKVYNDLVSRQTWQINRGILVNSTTDPVPVDKLDARGDTLWEKIKLRMLGQYAEINATDATVGFEVNWAKIGMSGGDTWTITIPTASSQVNTPDYNFAQFYEQSPGDPIGVYEVRDTDGLLITTVEEPTLLIIVNDVGQWKILSEIKTSNALQAPTQIDIGPWNIDGASNITIAHGQANKEAIKQISGRIRNDANTTLYNLTDDEGTHIRWNDTEITIERENGSEFNNGAFSGTGFSRGILFLTLA